MKISVRERILVILLVLSVIVGVVGCMLLDRIVRTQCDDYFQMLCRERGKSIDEMLGDISARLDVVGANIESDMARAVDPEYEVYIRYLSTATITLLKQVIENYDGHGFAYIKFNVDFNLPDTGCFLEKDGDEVKSLPMTDIAAYSPDDISHVGWYYIPLEYGAPMWMEPYYNVNVDTYMISYVVPIYFKDKPYCVVGMDVDMTELIDTVESMTFYETGFAVLYDKAGHPLHDSREIPDKGYVTATHKLRNGMSITVYVPQKEVYPMHYSNEYGLIICFHVLVLLVVMLVLLFSVRMHRGDEMLRRISHSYATLLLRTVVVLLFLSQVGVLLYDLGVFNSSRYLILQEKQYDTRISAVADEDFEPFSFVNENGQITGYSVEMANAMANRMKLNIDIKLMDGEAARKAVETGEADIFLGMPVFAHRKEDTLIYTDVMARDAIVVYGKKDVPSITAMQGARVARVRSDYFPDIYGFDEKADFYDTCEEALKSVVDGTNDYVIARRSVANAIIRREGYENLSQVYDLMESQLCIGLSPENNTLMRKLNASLQELESAGTLDKLDDKWIESYLSSMGIYEAIRKNELFFILSAILIVLCIMGSMFISYNRRNRELSVLSETDALTGINNRRAGESRIRNYIEEKRAGMFLLFDADKFKSINDTYGHGVGDLVLIAIAEGFKKVFPEEDVVMRFGGDEYAGFGVDIRDQEEGIRRIEALFEAMDMIDLPELQGRRVSISLGAAFYDPDSDMGFDELYRAADKGAYESKKRPGNTFTFIGRTGGDEDQDK